MTGAFFIEVSATTNDPFNACETLESLSAFFTRLLQ